MNDFTLMHVFFYITGTAVIIVTILAAIALWYIIMFVRSVKKITQTAQRATELVSEDLYDLRNNIKTRGFKWAYLITFAKNVAKNKLFPSPSSSKRK